MLYELDPQEYERVQPLFTGLDNRVAIPAIIEGRAPGRIFVDDPTNPSVAFMWNEFRYSFLAGSTDNQGFNDSLRQLLAETLLPEAAGSHDPTLVLYPHPQGWSDKLVELVGGWPLILLARKTFTFYRSRFEGLDWSERVPPGFHMQRIDGALFKRIGPEKVGVGVLWRSVDDFVAQGAGFCLLHGDEAASTCFSAFVGGGKAEISVETAPAYRRRGLATLSVAAFVDHCLRNGLDPVWECWAENIPSVGLAQKLGFEPAIDYPVYFLELA